MHGLENGRKVFRIIFPLRPDSLFLWRIEKGAPGSIRSGMRM
jgi:hypothetical protein